MTTIVYYPATTASGRTNNVLVAAFTLKSDAKAFIEMHSSSSLYQKTIEGFSEPWFEIRKSIQ